MTKNDVVVELYYSGDWHDITATDDVYTRNPIAITRGRPDEVQRVPPSTMNLSIENRDGKYSPRNPTSPLYGIIGRNTPIRAFVRLVRDTFTRTVVDGWGTADTGQAWALAWVGGAATDFDVAGGVGTHVVDGTVEYRISLLNSIANNKFTDDEVSVTFTPSMSNVTGGSIEPANLMLRIVDVSNYYFLRVEITTAEVVNISIRKIVANVETVLVGPLAVPGLVFAGQALRASFQAEGQILQAKVWDPATGEPFGWQLTVVDDTYTEPGLVGVRTGVASGNTNIPVTVSYDNFEVRIPRTHAEIESWPQRWSVEGNDVWAPVTANGILRRLNAPGTTRPAHSPLRRAVDLSADANSLYAYWPMEDGATATQASSVVAGVPALTGTVDGPGGTETLMPPNIDAPWPGSSSGLNISDGGAAPLTVALTSTVTAGWSISIITSFVGPGETYYLVDFTSPTLGGYVGITSDGAFEAVFYGPVELVAQLTTFPGTYNGSGYRHVLVTAVQNGANIDVALLVDNFEADTATITGKTLVTPAEAIVGSGPDISDSSTVYIGHLSMYSDVATVDFFNAAGAHAGETAADRIERVFTEDSVTIVIVGDANESEVMGVQKVAPILDLVNDAVEADGGLLYEPRGFLGMVYRTRGSLYNQSPVLELDYAAGGELAPPLDPVEDTDATGNDIMVTRYQGSSASAVQETGPLNVQEPSDDPDGVGRIRKDFTLVLDTDDQCGPQAYWRRHLGTWDEARYPVVSMDLTAMFADGKNALVHRAASLNVGDRFAIANPPAWVPPEDIVQHAQGFTETLGSHWWGIATNATPALPYEVMVVETADDNRPRVPSGRGSTTTNEAMDTTETGMDIISTSVRWIDSATYSAMFPFDVMVSGERMTVTALTGTTLTQTMTVTRSVNGVVKSHASGVEVQLFQPPVLAL